MKNRDKKISVVMTAYNGESYIGEQINSVLSQLSAGDELIIGDDRSADSTLEIIKSFKDPRIKLIVNEQNLGVIKNISRLLNKVNGRYVFLSDQDDVWLPEKVKHCLSQLENHDLLVHNGFFIDGDGKSLNKTIFDCLTPSLSYLKNLAGNRYVGACMAFTDTFLSTLLPIPENIPMHDWYIAQRALRLRKKIKIEERELILYRRHADNVSSTGCHKSNLHFCEKLKGRLQLFIRTVSNKTV
ncbi:Alpha-L-Rha alpha-1,3-L-rhamnosyltransferase [Chitinispirillum alkaliphilum]|nr:Alpha-L-Rha alpha-1,3-L-rhamnosyltransferase [Chitinispirillum alkaliphilum]